MPRVSTTALSVDLYRFSRLVHLNSLNAVGIWDEASSILSAFSGRTRMGTFDSPQTFNINPSVLEIYNLRYTEKQVGRIDENFYTYSQGIRLALSTPIAPPPRSLRYLVNKYFSGDVSGDIGESLFVYFLVEQLRVDRYNIGHLRPEKRRGFLTPDFIVSDDTQAMQPFFGEPYNAPVIAEVKSSTGIFNVDRISDGLNQLKALMQPGHYGLLVLVRRNESRQAYEIRFVGVRG